MNQCPKSIAWRSEKYLAFVRSKPCLVCGRESVAHHEPLGMAGMAIKCPDSHALCLCAKCHHDRHHLGFKTFWDRHRIAPEMEIIRLLTEYVSK